MLLIKALLKLIASDGGKYLLSMVIFFVGVTFEAFDRAIIGDQLMALAVVFLFAHSPHLNPPPTAPPAKPIRARSATSAKGAKTGAKLATAGRATSAKALRKPKLARPVVDSAQ